MRRLALATLALTALAAVGCAVDDSPLVRPPVATVEEAVIEDGKADDAFGQPDLTTGAEPTFFSSMNTHLPAGITAGPPTGLSNLLWIADFDAHRVLGVTTWRASPLSSTAASYLMGQSDWSVGLPNRGGAANATTLYRPSALAFSFSYLAVADTGNHRVLVAYASGFPLVAAGVFGQHGSFTNTERNDGGVGKGSLADPAGLAVDSIGRLYVADTGNHRVLVFTSLFTPDAGAVYGQGDFESAAVNRGGAVGPDTLNTPLGLVAWRSAVPSDVGGVYIADSGNHRVLHLGAGATTADVVYGQLGSFTTATPAKGGISASSLRSPSGVAVDAAGGLWIADTGHHRVLHFKKGSTVADRVLGQSTFVNGAPPTSTSPSSLYSPTSVVVVPAGDVFVADTGASRVVRFKITAKTPGGCDDGDPCTNDLFDPTYGCQHTSTPNSTECAPYQCDLSTRTCRTTCSVAAGIGCHPPALCQNGTCAQPCVVGPASTCKTGTYCVDGYCCDSRCDHRCGACNLAGKEGRCSVVTGRPYGIGRTCPGIDSECSGDCAGTDFDSCLPTPPSRACGAEYCEDGVAHLRGHCDESGRCLPIERDCGAYGCAPNGCRTSCDDDSHCASDAQCLEGRCVASRDRVASGTGCDLSRAPRGASIALLSLGALALCAGARRRRRRR